jgi:hypothetical protein
VRADPLRPCRAGGREIRLSLRARHGLIRSRRRAGLFRFHSSVPVTGHYEPHHPGGCRQHDRTGVPVAMGFPAPPPRVFPASRPRRPTGICPPAHRADRAA